MQILVKNRNFGLTFRRKLEISVKNWNFGEKSNFLRKIEILDKNRNFGRKSKFWTKIKILDKKRNLGQKWQKNFVKKEFHWNLVEMFNIV